MTCKGTYSDLSKTKSIHDNFSLSLYVIRTALFTLYSKPPFSSHSPRGVTMQVAVREIYFIALSSMGDK